MRLQDFLSAASQLKGVTVTNLQIEAVAPSKAVHSLNALGLDFMILFLEKEIVMDSFEIFADEMMYGFSFAKNVNSNEIYLLDGKTIMMKCCSTFEEFWDIVYVALIMSVLYDANSSLSTNIRFKDALVASLITDFLDNDETCFKFCRNIIG